MNRKLLFIFNPHSGKGLIRNYLVDIVDTMVKAEFDVTIYTTQARADATRKVLEEGAGYDQIVCSGGDGTLDEVVTGMIQANLDIPLGYIPAGSTNDFANSLGIEKEMRLSCLTAVHGTPFPCDIGRFNDDTFVYVAAFGLFTDVSYETSQDVKNVLGHLAYILEGIKKLTDIKTYPMRVESEEMTVEGDFIFGMVTNSTSVGGFRNITGKHVHLDDGVFEVTLIKTPQNILELNEIIQAVLAGKSDNNKYFYQFRSRAVKFISGAPVAWTQDGEFGGYHEVVDVKNDRQALRLLV